MSITTKKQALEYIKELKKTIINDFISAKQSMILNSSFEKIILDVFKYTELGTHAVNPYHNPLHCYAVFEIAFNYFKEEPIKRSGKVKAYYTLLLASLFHDYNHSGKSIKEIKDIDNINKAILGLKDFKYQLKLISDSELIWAIDDFDVKTIVKDTISLIKTTEVQLIDNRLVFPNEPENYMAKCLRDADVTMAFSSLGSYLIKGLAKEMGVPYDKQFKENQINFISSIKLYTPTAERLRQDYLKTNY